MPVIRAMLDWGQIGGQVGQWDRGKVRRNGGIQTDVESSEVNTGPQEDYGLTNSAVTL